MDFVFKRAVYFKICRQLSDASLAKIGETVVKDHTTVMNGIRIFDADIADGKGYAHERYKQYYESAYKNAKNALLQKGGEKNSAIIIKTIVKQHKELVRLRHRIAQLH